MPDRQQLRPVTLYLPQHEIDALEREAAEAGRSGLSAHVRWILATRRGGTAGARVRRRPDRPSRGGAAAREPS